VQLSVKPFLHQLALCCNFTRFDGRASTARAGIETPTSDGIRFLYTERMAQSSPANINNNLAQ
jgi:hypothetical protein